MQNRSPLLSQIYFSSALRPFKNLFDARSVLLADAFMLLDLLLIAYQ
jgi:hypothetical protein